MSTDRLPVEEARHLIQKVIERTGRKAVSGIPSPERLDELSAKLNVEFPQGFRDWLQLSNGWVIGRGGIFGIENGNSYIDLAEIIPLFPKWRMRGWLPIAGDGSGNYYVVAMRQQYGLENPILFIDTSSSENDPAYIVASNIWHFLRFYLGEELGQSSWPFGKDYVLKADPALATASGVRLPWNA